MSEEQGCVEQLKRIGIAPEDIRYVVLSHCTLIIREQLVASPMLRMLSRGKSMNMPLPLTGLLREPIADAISIVPNLTGYF
ncbi:N-acylhomoserine lactone degredation protein AhlK [Klebsiella aerogenes]|nr:N-acylhomoserine lactone degredation protein AhlK [Klebsiella aerogenes]